MARFLLKIAAIVFILIEIYIFYQFIKIRSDRQFNQQTSGSTNNNDSFGISERK